MSENPAKGNDKGKTASATNSTVGVSRDALGQENAELHEANDKLTAMVTLLEKKLAEANSFIEADVRESKIKRIMEKSNYTRTELDQQYPPGDEESLKTLQKLDESLSRGLGSASVTKGKTGSFKPVSSAKDSITLGTLPDMYGKDRATILKELSEM